MSALKNIPALHVPLLAVPFLLPILTLGIAFIYVVFLGIYNVFFHPLRHYPGPLLNAATRLTWSWQAVSGKSQFILNDLHDRYGPVVRIGPNELSYIDPRVWKDVYQSRSGQPQMQKDPLHYQKHDRTPSLHVSSDADHTRMRRLIAHAFSEKALREQEPIMQQYSSLLISRLHEVTKGGGAINIKQWYHWMLFDLFGDLCFNHSFRCVENGKSHPWIDIIGQSINAFYYIGLARRIPGLYSLMMKFIIPKKRVEQAEWHSKFSTDMADRRMAMVTDRPDFMSFVLKHNATDKALTVPEIRSNCNVLIPGGSETTSTFLTGTTWHLCKNPSVYKSLVDDIRSTFESMEDITLARCASMKYLNAVIDEGLRIYPPVPSNMPRVIPDEGASVAGQWVPGGTSVCVAPYPMFLNSRNFKNPTSFVPERWLGDPEYAQDKTSAVQPFSYGPRNCIGKNLAYSEMRLILCKLLWNFDITLIPESEQWFPHDMLVVWKSPDLLLKLHPVQREHTTFDSPVVSEEKAPAKASD